MNRTSSVIKAVVPAVRLQVFSDLHFDARPVEPPVLAPGVDVVVVAGDTCEGPERGFAYLRRFIPAPTPIVVVAGNHEHYHRAVDEMLAEARHNVSTYGVTFLENAAAAVAGVRFLGCTLWTDYCLDGPQWQASAMAQARRGLNDHHCIAWRSDPWERFRPQEALAMHRASRAFLATALAEPFDGPTVVVTHHAPHPGSVHPTYAGDPLNPAFVSDLSDLIEAGRPDLWVHGHVHNSFDYRVGSTRVLCNPHGYGSENAKYDPQLIVEVAR